MGLSKFPVKGLKIVNLRALLPGSRAGCGANAFLLNNFLSY